MLPQLAAMLGAVAIGRYATGTLNGAILGGAVYLAYSIGSRQLIARAHRHGMRLYRNRQYSAAIEAFQSSYDFFTSHAWIDRFRSIVMMSPSAMSYREMALCNIAFCYSQIGDGDNAERYYRQALDEFPDSGLAAAALRMIESFKQQPTEPVAE